MTVVPLKSIIAGEFAENTERKDFQPSELVPISKALKPAEAERAKERKDARRATWGKVTTT